MRFNWRAKAYSLLTSLYLTTGCGSPTRQISEGYERTKPAYRENTQKEYRGIKIEPIGVDDYDGDGKQDAVFLVRDFFGKDKTAALCISEPHFEKLAEGFYVRGFNIRLVGVINREWPFSAEIEKHGGGYKLVVTGLREQ